MMQQLIRLNSEKGLENGAKIGSNDGSRIRIRGGKTDIFDVVLISVRRIKRSKKTDDDLQIVQNLYKTIFVQNMYHICTGCTKFVQSIYSSGVFCTNMHHPSTTLYDMIMFCFVHNMYIYATFSILAFQNLMDGCTNMYMKKTIEGGDLDGKKIRFSHLIN